MVQDWQALTEMLRDKKFIVTRVEVGEIAIEGKFDLPPMAKLCMEDQVFIATFIAVSGSIKEMERMFGVSYPTIKARLKKITTHLQKVGLVAQKIEEKDISVLNRLENREISVEEAVEALSKCSR